MIGRSPHLHDERLLTCYVAERGGERVDPPLAEHLAECADCNARYDGLVRFLDDLRTDADTALDTLFPAERLDAQRLAIARRLEHLGQAARVISFPARPAENPVSVSGSRQTARWVAAAAVAGLFVGLVLGAFSNIGAPVGPVEVAVSQPVPTDPLSVRLPLDEETFLRELELARGRQRTRALMPLDAFTPSIREVNAQLR